MDNASPSEENNGDSEPPEIWFDAMEELTQIHNDDTDMKTSENGNKTINDPAPPSQSNSQQEKKQTKIYKKLKSELEKSKEDIHNLNERYRQSTNDVKKLNEQIQKFEAEKVKLAKEIDVWKQSSNQMQTEKEKIESQLTENQKHMQLLNEDVVKAESHERQLQETLQKTELENCNLKALETNLKAKVLQHEKQIPISTDQIQSLQKELTKMKKKVLERSADFFREKKEKEKAVQLSLKCAQQQQNLSKLLLQKENEISSIKAIFLEHLYQIRDEKNELEKVLSAKMAEIDELNDCVQRTGQECAENKIRQSHLERELSATVQKLKTKQQLYNNLKGTYTARELELVKRQIEIEGLVQQNALAQENLQKAEKTIEEMKTENTQLKEQIDMGMIERTGRKEDIKKKEQANRRCLKEITSLRNQVERLKTENGRLRSFYGHTSFDEDDSGGGNLGF